MRLHEVSHNLEKFVRQVQGARKFSLLGLHTSALLISHFPPQKLFKSSTSSHFTKDAFHRYIIDNEIEAVNPSKEGTKVAARYVLTVPPGGQQIIRCHLTAHKDQMLPPTSTSAFDDIVSQRKHEADKFYNTIIPGNYTFRWSQMPKGCIMKAQYGKKYEKQ